MARKAGEADLWARIEPLFARIERPVRYIGGEWGAVSPDAASAAPSAVAAPSVSTASSDAASTAPSAAAAASAGDGSPPYRVVLIYPDTYELGQANQAIGILYGLLNALDNVIAERCFLPAAAMADAMRAEGIPLFSLESCTPVSEFDLVGITLPYEMTYTNVLEVLDLAGIALRAADREKDAPLVVGGGPGAFNPEPVAPFFDAVLVGEGEDAAAEIVEAHRRAASAGCSRPESLALLAKEVSGLYVPTLYEPQISPQGRFAGMRAVSPAPADVHKRTPVDLSAHTAPVCPVVPYMDVVHDRVNIEILRGCSRGCRFCQAGMVYRPVRERSADEVVASAIKGLRHTGYDEVSLTSLSSADYSMLGEVLRRLKSRLADTGVSVSLPSLRADALSIGMAGLLGGGKKAGLTFAPEAGTQRLRDVINKNVTEKDLLETVQAACLAGWQRVKLYFMIGLPTETDEDLGAIGRLVGRVLAEARSAVDPKQRSGVRVAVSISTFVPKPHTPFQWESQISIEETRRRQSVVREHMPRKGVELSWHDAETSFLEGMIARGGREVAEVIEAAWLCGARFDAWSEQFSFDRWAKAIAEAGVDAAGILSRERDSEELLPWDHILTGVSKRYLVAERERAFSGEVTEDCSFLGCTGCGVCDGSSDCSGASPHVGLSTDSGADFNSGPDAGDRSGTGIVIATGRAVR